MTPDTRQSLGKILNSHIPDWDALSQQAYEAMNGQAMVAKVSWNETDSFRKPRKGMVHDIWKIEGGICLKRRPSFLERIFLAIFRIFVLLFTPLVFIQRKIEEFIFALSSKLGLIGGIISLPFKVILMIIDFIRVFMGIIGSITSPLSFILMLLSLPILLIKIVISRLVEAFLTPLLAKIFSQISEKAQQSMIVFLKKHGWFRNVLLGILRNSNRPGLPVIIPKKNVSEIFVKQKWGKKYLCVVEGDKLKPGFAEFIFLKIKQILFPYYWERTVHMILLPKKEVEQVQADIEAALAVSDIDSEDTKLIEQEQVEQEQIVETEAEVATEQSQKSKPWVFAGIGLGVLLLLAGIIAMMTGNNNKDTDTDTEKAPVVATVEKIEPNSMEAIRTGLQANGKTRLVIETTKMPSYSLEYFEKQLQITLKNTLGEAKPNISAKTLVSNITSNQSDDSVVISVSLTRSINEIPKEQTMVLEPSEDNKNFRLVLDFEAVKSR
jgi:hypothetical protein